MYSLEVIRAINNRAAKIRDNVKREGSIIVDPDLDTRQDTTEEHALLGAIAWALVDGIVGGDDPTNETE